MLDWFGGGLQVVNILMPLFGVCALLIARTIADTNRAWRWVVSAFGCWFGVQLLIGLEEGTLISFPHPVGLLTAILLLVGFIALWVRGLFAAWKTRQSSESPP